MTAACVILTEGATAALTFISVPGTVAVGSPFEVDGRTTAPSAADVEWVISDQNDDEPSSGWAPIQGFAGGIFAFIATIGSAGIFFAWVRQVSTHAVAVSSPIVSQ